VYEGLSILLPFLLPPDVASLNLQFNIERESEKLIGGEFVIPNYFFEYFVITHYVLGIL
jgi:hypothetical protein